MLKGEEEGMEIYGMKREYSGKKVGQQGRWVLINNLIAISDRIMDKVIRRGRFAPKKTETTKDTDRDIQL